MVSNSNNVIFRRLLPGHKFVIRCFGDSGSKFVKNFRETWRHIPLKVRRAIIKMWSSNKGTIPLYPKMKMYNDLEHASVNSIYDITKDFGPNIELSNWVPEGRHAFVKSIGMEVKFCQKHFIHLPDPAAQYLIAHELAHVYQKCMGRKPGGENEDENETHADNLAKEWGFTPDLLDLIHNYCIKKDLSFENGCKDLFG